MTKTELFQEALEDAGYEVEHYHGRASWHGPAVRTRTNDEFQDVLSLAKEAGVRCQWDSLGLGMIVYPIESEPGSGLDCLKRKQQKQREAENA